MTEKKPASSVQRFLLWSLFAVVLGLLVAGGAYWAYWNFYARFQPVTIRKHQAEIQTLLDRSGWVSPGLQGPWVYVIGHRACDDCVLYQREEFPKLQAVHVDTRVVAYARGEREGLVQSTETERSTVAELWIGRDWSLYERWTSTPRDAWKAEGIAKADDSLARTAVVNAGQAFVDDLTKLLKANGLTKINQPIIVWRDAEGYLKACACDDRRSWRFIRADLDAPDKAPKVVSEAQAAPAPLPAPVGPPVETPAVPPSAPAATPAPEAAAPSPSPPPAKTAMSADNVFL